MSDRKSRRTSINSALGAEFFNRVAITLRITNVRHNIQVKHIGECKYFHIDHIPKQTIFQNSNAQFTWVLNLDSRVRIKMRLVNDLRAHLLCQDLEEFGRHPSHTRHMKTSTAEGK